MLSEVFGGQIDSNQSFVIVFRLLLAWGAGTIVARFSRLRRREATDETLPVTLVLMSVLIAMATQIIGDNIARAFSLVGALSIVRFRTVVPSTQDVALVLTSVVVGMAIGAGQAWIAGLGLGVVAMALRVHSQWSIPQSRRPQSLSRLTLQVTVGGHDACQAVLDRLCSHCELVAIETERKGAAMSYQYRVALVPNMRPQEAIAEFSRLPVVESVAWDAAKV